MAQENLSEVSDNL